MPTRNTMPIFVVGFPRSGTTLTQALLGSHPHIAAPPEMSYFRRVRNHPDYWGDLNDDTVLRRVIETTLDRRSLDDCGFDVDRIMQRVVKTERSFAGVLDATMRDFAERQGKVRWSEKTPLQYASAIWSLFPEALIVHVVRNPIESVASTSAKLALYRDPAAVARGWRQFTRANMKTGEEKGPSHYLRVRYEDLTEDPETVLAQVLAFVGEEFDPTMATDVTRRQASVPKTANPWMSSVLEPIRRANDQSSRNAFNRWQRARVAAIVTDVAAELGYEPLTKTEALTGRALNAIVLPLDRLRDRRAERERGRARTPEERYERMRANLHHFSTASHEKVGG